MVENRRGGCQRENEPSELQLELHAAAFAIDLVTSSDLSLRSVRQMEEGWYELERAELRCRGSRDSLPPHDSRWIAMAGQDKRRTLTPAHPKEL